MAVFTNSGCHAKKYTSPRRGTPEITCRVKLLPRSHSGFSIGLWFANGSILFLSRCAAGGVGDDKDPSSSICACCSLKACPTHSFCRHLLLMRENERKQVVSRVSTCLPFFSQRRRRRRWCNPRGDVQSLPDDTARVKAALASHCTRRRRCCPWLGAMPTKLFAIPLPLASHSSHGSILNAQKRFFDFLFQEAGSTLLQKS